jgi:hypothetical protein
VIERHQLVVVRRLVGVRADGRGCHAYAWVPGAAPDSS